MKYLSLFSGVGSPEMALRDLGVEYDLVGFSEIDKYAIESYCAIHGVDKSKNLGDITTLDIEGLPKSIDLITHGSPCQDFSIAGKGEGGDKNSNTRSSLMWNTVEVVQYTHPRYVVWENVRGVLSKGHRHNFDMYLNAMESMGYSNYYKILNAKDYGVPQNRERIFVVSICKDIDNNNFEFPKPNDTGIRLRDILEKVVDEKYYISRDKTEKLISQLEDMDTIMLDMSQAKREGIPREYTNYSPTLSARDYKEPRLILELSQHKLRKITPLECWRLMGFRDSDYHIARRALETAFYKGKDRSNSQMYKQAGNSIAQPCIQGILKNLLGV